MLTVPVSDDVLRHAIELRISKCFSAMNFANALGGTPSPAWDLVRRAGLDEMIADALDRGMPVKEFRAAVDNTPFMDTAAYLRVRDVIGGRTDFPQ